MAWKIVKMLKLWLSSTRLLAVCSTDKNGNAFHCIHFTWMACASCAGAYVELKQSNTMLRRRTTQNAAVSGTMIPMLPDTGPEPVAWSQKRKTNGCLTLLLLL